MRQLFIAFLILGLVVGTAAIVKADVNVNFGGHEHDYGYRSHSDRDFDRWESRMRSRMDEGLRSGDLTKREYRDLEQELSSIESFHSQAWSDGRISPREESKLKGMEDRLQAKVFVDRHDRERGYR